jgi:hypothetical protein
MSTGSGPLGRDRIDRDATSATGLLPKGGIQPLSFRECKGLTCRVRDRPRTTSNVDPEDHVWVFDRCEDKGCAGSSLAPISATLRRRLLGAGMFVAPPSGRTR